MSLLLLALLLNRQGAPSARAQEEPRQAFLTLVNSARLGVGQPPLYRSTLLEQAAQRHADDLAVRGLNSDEGADGSTHRQRIRETGYRAWNDGLMVNQVIWMGLGSVTEAFTWLRSTSDQWPLFVDPRYREAGIGYAEDNQGVHYLVIVFGARPGVLPIFLNDGAEFTDSPTVDLTLTNEDAVPLGEGTWMGKAIEVRVSNTPEFEGLAWQPWEPLLPWLLAGREPGDYAVYVEFRDGAGRTAIAEDTIRLVAPGEAPPMPTPLTPLQPIATLASPTPASTQPTQSAAPATPAEPAAPTATLRPSPTPTSALFPSQPLPTWTPLAPPDQTVAIAIDWPVVILFVLQGMAVLLLIGVFLRRR